MRPSSAAKRRAVLAAAEEAFLAAHYESVTMDDLARSSGVSKQTVYAHFGTKEQLFIELVTSMTRLAADDVHQVDALPIESADRIAPVLESILSRQLEAVLQPRMLRLRRLVIGEVPRFPELARAVFEHGPQRAVAVLAQILSDLDARDLLSVPDPTTAATQLNWLVMGAPVNDAMFLGDDAIPSTPAQRDHVRAAVATFLSSARRSAE
ncbi:TetR/AcrR family transcriptional regulator [Mumia sp.]|uniref:TetR/AcrR family transcriptional regulator n=1 Tax=Mumia sp. TaxID=1965300 RepID=UPI0026116595|nr:TetR/AcrR family transcriptional regulator [Mumia sp.]MDD9350616.1 TetR/AcrR family transcriptional regulator [Mumia sp.]